MDNSQIFKEATHLIHANKIAWLYICISIVSFFFPSAESFGTNLPLLCTFNLVIWSVIALSTLFYAGLVYDISQQYLYKKAISIYDGYSRGKASIWKIIGLSFLLFTPIILFYLAFWALSHKVPSPYSIFGLSIQLFLVPLTIFGLCGIVIDKIRPFKSALTSILIIRQNLSRVLILSGIFILTEKILLVLLITGINQLFPITFPFPLNLDLATYNNLIHIPIIVRSNSVLSTIMYPWETAVLTIAYLHFTKDVSRPAVEQGQTAA
jgi:hypothetical protein